MINVGECEIENILEKERELIVENESVEKNENNNVQEVNVEGRLQECEGSSVGASVTYGKAGRAINGVMDDAAKEVGHSSPTNNAISGWANSSTGPEHFLNQNKVLKYGGGPRLGPRSSLLEVELEGWGYSVERVPETTLEDIVSDPDGNKADGITEEQYVQTEVRVSSKEGEVARENEGVLLSAVAVGGSAAADSVEGEQGEAPVHQAEPVIDVEVGGKEVGGAVAPSTEGEDDSEELTVFSEIDPATHAAEAWDFGKEFGFGSTKEVCILESIAKKQQARSEAAAEIVAKRKRNLKKSKSRQDKIRPDSVVNPKVSSFPKIKKHKETHD